MSLMSNFKKASIITVAGLVSLASLITQDITVGTQNQIKSRNVNTESSGQLIKANLQIENGLKDSLNYLSASNLQAPFAPTPLAQTNEFNPPISTNSISQVLKDESIKPYKYFKFNNPSKKSGNPCSITPHHDKTTTNQDDAYSKIVSIKAYSSFKMIEGVLSRNVYGGNGYLVGGNMVLTANHVVSQSNDGIDSLEVTLKDGSIYLADIFANSQNFDTSILTIRDFNLDVDGAVFSLEIDEEQYVTILALDPNKNNINHNIDHLVEVSLQKLNLKTVSKQRHDLKERLYAHIYETIGIIGELPVADFETAYAAYGGMAIFANFWPYRQTQGFVQKGMSGSVLMTADMAIAGITNAHIQVPLFEYDALVESKLTDPDAYTSNIAKRIRYLNSSDVVLSTPASAIVGFLNAACN